VPLPSSFINHLRQSGYHPRSDKHSNALGEAIVTDLVSTCDLLAERAAAGEVVYRLNFDLIYGTAEWNVDVVLGTPPPGTGPPPPGELILRATPSSVQIAIELKAVMTEHRKAVKNRKRDLEAHHEHVHNYNPQAIAGGVLVINASDTFQSPLRQGLTRHSNVGKLVQHCVNEAAAISVAGGPTGYGLDAKSVIVVEMDNVNLAAAKFFEKPPAPQVGDPMHYDSFIQRLCSEYKTRFGP
jgi:hypothetical protein